MQLQLEDELWFTFITHLWERNAWMDFFRGGANVDTVAVLLWLKTTHLIASWSCMLHYWYLSRPVWFSIKVCCFPRRRVANKPVWISAVKFKWMKDILIEKLNGYFGVYPAHCLFEHNCCYGVEQMRRTWCEVFRASPALLMNWKPKHCLPPHTHGFCLPFLLISQFRIGLSLSRILQLT